MVEVGSIVEEKVSFGVYIKNERKKKKLLNAYKMYLLLLALVFALFDIFLINDNYLSLIITLLSMLAGIEISTFIGQSVRYFLLKPIFISGLCPYCQSSIKLIKENDKNILDKNCPVCSGSIEVEVIN